jgi:hypothetical protein
MTESTGLLGLAAARKTELSDDEVVLAFATGANPEHDKDSSAIRRYLQAKNV